MHWVSLILPQNLNVFCKQRSSLLYCPDITFQQTCFCQQFYLLTIEHIETVYLVCLELFDLDMVISLLYINCKQNQDSNFVFMTINSELGISLDF